MSINDILQKVEILSSYSDFLPEEVQVQFLGQISVLKKAISTAPKSNGVPEEFKPGSSNGSNNLPPPPVKPFSPPPPRPSVMPSMTSFQPVKPAAPAVVKGAQEENSRHNFVHVMESLIPRLTDAGKNMLGDLSFPIELYRSLKLIDDKTSLYTLYNSHSHNFDSFFAFLNLLYRLHQNKYIDFIRNQEIKNKGWIRLGELFYESRLVTVFDVEKAVNYQKNNRSYIGEALMKLNLISEETLRDSLKLQRWFSKMSEQAFLVKTVSSVPKQDTVSTDENYLANILDFIIPAFTEKGKTVLADPAHKELASRLQIIDGEKSLFRIFETYKQSFKDNMLAFLKFVFKLETQDFLFYKKNLEVQERDVWIKFGELLISLGLLTKEQVDKAFEYRAAMSKGKELFIGEVLLELKYMELETLEECLKIQRWCNMVLAKISYENSFVEAVKDVLKDSFNCPVDIGSFKKISFASPVSNMICIIYTIKGKLNGRVYYILDRSFFVSLTRSIMASLNMTDDNLDSSVVSEISSMITGSSLTRLSNLGLFCETGMPEIIMDKELIIAERKPISTIPLMNQWGRFAIGLEING